jgi:hypothetical protein
MQLHGRKDKRGKQNYGTATKGSGQYIHREQISSGMIWHSEYTPRNSCTVHFYLRPNSVFHFIAGETRAFRALYPACLPAYPYTQRFRMKTFTLDEAQSLLPVLESLLKRAMESKQAAEEAEANIVDLSRRIYLMGGMRVDASAVALQRAEVNKHLDRVRETVSEIDEIGVQVKDLESGLLDFPCRLDDEVVLLCWRLGESSIEHWHTVDSGFKGRQPVDERFRRRSNNKPN